jgi:hypothetical protein
MASPVSAQARASVRRKDFRQVFILERQMEGWVRAWGSFSERENKGEGEESVIRQTAIFDLAGLACLLYWYALYPVLSWIFSGTLREMAAAGEREGGRLRSG